MNSAASIHGQAEVEFTKPVTKRDTKTVVSMMRVRNPSHAPIARLTIEETWYDAAGALVASSKGTVDGLLQPDETQDIKIQTPYDSKMHSNNYQFSHANGTVKPRLVESLRAQTAPSERPAFVQNTALGESARTAVAKMVNLGLIKRMNDNRSKFYIDGPLWEGFELDAKENIVKVISGYREAEYKGLPQVTLYDSRSGRELASYGVFSGVTIR